jgi:hypothetical protein
MGIQLNTLLRDIERCRMEMVHLASHSSLSDHQVLEVSTQLDALLNKFNFLVSSRNA